MARSWTAAVCVLLVAPPLPGLAHETDQYSLPAGRDFAELGTHFTRSVHRALVEAADDANRLGAERADADDPLQTADFIAGLVWQRLFQAFPTNELLDLSVGGGTLAASHPGLTTLHRADDWIYDDPLLLLDLSKLTRLLLRAGTVSVGGTPIGTDKIIHFVNLGRTYHGKYLSGLRRGLSPAQATARAIASTSRNPLTSENGLFGLATTGIRSNADLAANYAGLLFYRNLTEPVRIGERELPPMLRRKDGQWQVQARADSDFFTAFVTPHWNEVLNPNTYLGYVGKRVRAQVRTRCAQVLDYYRDARGRPMTRQEFAAIEQELATFYGVPYDHAADREAPVSVATVCFDDAATAAAAQAATGARPGADALDRTSLWWAARLDRVDDAIALAPSPAELNATDVDGETPLHAATRAPGIGMLQWLLDRGADPNRSALYGVTPLLLAVETGREDAATVLLQGGADPNLAGPFGRTPLQASVTRGDTGLTERLLAHGAALGLGDDRGNTALHLAAARDETAQVQLLLAHGADPNARNRLGLDPAAEARRLGHDALARYLDDARRSAAAVLPAPHASAGMAGAPVRAAASIDDARDAQ